MSVSSAGTVTPTLLFFSFVCMMHMCVCEYDVRCLSVFLSNSLCETRFLTEPITYLVRLAGQQALGFLLSVLPSALIQMCVLIPDFLQGSKLWYLCLYWSLCLYGKHFTNCAISPALSLANLKGQDGVCPSRAASQS